MSELTPTSLAKAANISVSYASQVLSGSRTPNVRLALEMERLTAGRLRAGDLNPDVALVLKFVAEAANDDTRAEKAA